MLADEGADDVKVCVINTQVMECVVIGRWASLADLWQHYVITTIYRQNV